uniref:RNA-directed DNA polymerase, eukaryota n=1 Tax=Tanacetum cinerariifolium TaxID=118510 RepID=A0A6L2J9T5_TANCI|nr:RNA-directed DNA polymerase, eukaryota [Tanacetum cinerariifolium]
MRGVEQVHFLELLSFMEGVALVDMRDMWVWSLEGSGEFSVAYVRRLIDERWLPELNKRKREDKDERKRKYNLKCDDLVTG